MEEKFTREQELLKRLRDEQCGKNAAELARRLEKDPTYINRLLYPIGKKGRKGIGLEVMRAASSAFNLPAGYWEGADSPQPAVKGAHLTAPDKLEKQILAEMQHLTTKDKEKLLEQVRELADDRKAVRAEDMERSGLNRIQEQAAHASRQRSGTNTSVVVHRKPSTPRAAAVVDPTAPLPFEDDESK